MGKKLSIKSVFYCSDSARPLLLISRFPDEGTFLIIHDRMKDNIVMTPTDIDTTTNFVCDLMDGFDIKSVETDFGVKPVQILSDEDNLHSVVQKLLSYMLCVHREVRSLP